MRCLFLAAALVACVFGVAVEDVAMQVKKTKKHHSKHHGKHHGKHHHHHHGHGKHHKHDGKHADAKVVDAKRPSEKDVAAAVAGGMAGPVQKTPAHVKPVMMKAVEKKSAAPKVEAKAKPADTEDNIVKKMKALEAKLQKKKVDKQGQILVNGPLPADFKERFSQAVAHAMGAIASKVKITTTKEQGDGIVAVTFMASPHIVDSVEADVADPDSKLAAGNLHSFLVAKDDGSDDHEEPASAGEAKEEPAPRDRDQATPVQEKGIDIDTAMPYGDLEPFGREDTAQELTEDSVKESDEMVDQLERAEVAEEKRSVFRALTRLRGAAITSFDGVARSQTGNIDEYNKVHQWRTTHPLHHLADEESDISKWAFPDNADF